MKLKLKSKPKTIDEEIQQSIEDAPVEKKQYADLREVMDYNKDFSIFYSGVENDAYFKGCYDMGVRDFLMSYHYLQKSRVPMSTKYSGYNVKFFIDSGAFTYMQDPQYQNKEISFWEKHIERYLAWAEKNREYIFAIANLDLEALVGGEQVQLWNEKYFEPFMLRTGIPVCFVWHENTARSWEQYCSRYPYTGFSSVFNGQELTKTDYVDRLRTAEKHNTLVHGFGMTKIGLLPDLPYYTVDSTTWKSGFRYGKIIIWNGTNVKEIAKEDIEIKAFPVLDSYRGITFDHELLRNYYEPEILRACVKSFQLAEEYVRERLKPLIYWKRPKVNKRTDISNVKFPPIEWLKSSQSASDESWKEYATELNISTAIDNVDGINTVTDCTILLNWENPEYTDFRDAVYTDDVISQIHDTYINKIVPDTQTKISDLQKFFMENVTGVIDTLLMLGTNYDRRTKEREEYLDDEEYDLVDIPDLEVNNALSKYIPDKQGAPEIDSLDDEIFKKEEIIPVRDEQGHFLKGQKKVLKPKNIYSSKFPKLACDTCFAAQKCPEYKSGYVCAYNKIMQKFDSRKMEDVIGGMQSIVNYSISRTQKAMIFETLNGGIPDPTVTQLMEQSMKYMAMMKSMYESSSQEVLRQTRVIRSDGTQETSTSITNPSSGGILAQIFGANSNKDTKEEEPKEV